MFTLAKRFSSRSIFSAKKLESFNSTLPSKINKEYSIVRNAHQYDSYFSIGLFQNVEVVEKNDFMYDLQVSDSSIKELTRRCCESIDASETGSFFKHQSIANTFGVQHEVHNENFLMDFFEFSDIAKRNCALVSGNISPKSKIKSYEDWQILARKHGLGFRPDHYLMRAEYRNFNQDLEIIDIIAEDHRQWICCRNVPIFCSDIKARSNERAYDGVLKGIGQVVLYNAYLVNKLVTIPQVVDKKQVYFPRSSLDTITIPGFLFKNPYLYLFETTFTDEWLTAFEKDEYESLVERKSFPKVRVLCSGKEENELTITGALKSDLDNGKQVYGYNILNNPEEYFECLNVFDKFVGRRFEDGCADTMVKYLPSLSDTDTKIIDSWSNFKPLQDNQTKKIDL